MGLRRLSLNEAEYVVGQSRTAINRLFDAGLIGGPAAGARPVRSLGPAELRLVALFGEVDKDFTPAGRRKIWEKLRALPADAPSLDLGPVRIWLGDLDRGIAERLARLEQVRAMVAGNDRDDPVVKGTAIPVHAVAALAAGQSVAEIVEDFPGLSPEQVEAAIDYARIYPKAGRPYPPRSLKRMLADLAASGVWDVESEGEPIAPRPIP